MPTTKRQSFGITALIIVLIIGVITAMRFLAMRNAGTARIATPQYLFLLALTIVGIAGAVAVVLLRSHHTRRHPPVFGLALALLGAGFSLIGTSGIDLFLWLTSGQTPAPSETILNAVDAICLGCTVGFGLLAGVFFVRLALIWIAEDKMIVGSLRISALTPVLWLWFRIARYEVIHAGTAIRFFSFFDFLMLASSLLFLFSFAAFTANVGAVKRRKTMIIATCAAVTGISNTLLRFLLFAANLSDALEKTVIASLPDFMIGLIALMLVLYLIHQAPLHGHTKRFVMPDQPAMTRRTSASDAPSADAAATATAESAVDPLLELIVKPSSGAAPAAEPPTEVPAPPIEAVDDPRFREFHRTEQPEGDSATTMTVEDILANYLAEQNAANKHNTHHVHHTHHSH